MSFYAPYKSETKPYSSGSPVEFTNFVPGTGPRGGRTVVDRFCVRVTGTLTVATATWDGRDVSRVFNLITVEKKDGRLRWALSGARTRMAAIYLDGIDRWTEHADVGVGAGAAIDHYMNLPMAKRYMKGGDAYGLPADLLAKITLTWGAASDMQTGTTVISTIALNAYILAEWHEELKFVSHVDDLVKSVDFASQTEARILPVGNVHDLFIHKTGTTAGGGESLTAITDMRIEELGVPTLTRQDVTWTYARKRYATPSGSTTGGARFGDPFALATGKGLAVLTADEDTRAFDGKPGVSTFRLIVGTGVASSSVIYREVVPKSQADYQAEAAAYGFAPTDLSVKQANPGQSSAPLSKSAKAVLPWEGPPIVSAAAG